jgi:hypothetical protein
VVSWPRAQEPVADMALVARCSGDEGNRQRNAGGVARAGECDTMLGWDGEGHNKELQWRRPWSSEDTGGSELGPPAMVDVDVLYACEQQGRGWLGKGSAMVSMTGEGRRKDRLRRRSSGGTSSAARP